MNLRRKRLRLMRDTQWRGYARTAEGNPITLSQVRSLANLSVLGNSVQDGTPSLDNPVEVVGSGERTSNYCIVNDRTDTRYGITVNGSSISQYYVLNGTSTNIGNVFLEKNINFDIKQGETITLVAEIIEGNISYPENAVIYISLFDSTYTKFIRNTATVKPNKGSIILSTGQLPETENGYNIMVQMLGDTAIIFNNVKLRIRIYKGSYTTETLPSYEPYGYKIPIMAQEVENKKQINIYTTQPLHGVGETHDTVLLDFDNKKAQLTKQYEYFKVNETQWSRASDSYDGERTTDRYHMYTGLYSGKNSTDDSKCNILPKYNGVIWTNDTQGFTWNSAQLHLRINNDVLGINTSDTAEERTSKFTSYTQNNDIYVLGKLITPVVTDITALQQWETMPNLKGAWILTASGGTEPVIAAEYYSNERSRE